MSAPVTDLVAADIGGTHARFALAQVADGKVVGLGEPLTLRTDEFASLDLAWAQLRRSWAEPLPRAAALAIASPIGADEIRLTNNRWRVTPSRLNEELGLDRHLLVNDFGAVAHAVHHAPPSDFAHLSGPRVPLPDEGPITICGPGTGLGVAQLVRATHGYRVIETEGGHIGFAPTEAYEDRLVARLRERHGRVSAERVCAGPAIVTHYETANDVVGELIYEISERVIWDGVLAWNRRDALAEEAVDRFCQALGAVAGDLALAQGAKAVVIAGGLGLRLKARLRRAGFGQRFRAKGRFEGMMKALPVKLITHPQPGLFGAAAAFAAELG